MTDRRDEPAGVRFQCLAAIRGQREVRHRLSVAEFLLDGNHPTRLKAPGVGCKVAVGQSGGASQVHEFLPLLDRQGRKDGEPTRIGNQ